MKKEPVIKIKLDDWQELKKASHKLDEVAESNIDRNYYKKSSNRLFKVINKYEDIYFETWMKNRELEIKTKSEK